MIPHRFFASASFASKNSVTPGNRRVHEIQPADRIVQRIGRIGKASPPLTRYPWVGKRKGLNMRNPIAVSALVLVSGLITGVTAAQTSVPHITITPSTAQKVITGAPDR